MPLPFYMYIVQGPTAPVVVMVYDAQLHSIDCPNTAHFVLAIFQLFQFQLQFIHSIQSEIDRNHKIVIQIKSMNGKGLKGTKLH